MTLRLENMTKKDVIKLFRMCVPEPPENVVAGLLIMDKETKAVKVEEMLLLATRRLNTGTPQECNRLKRRVVALVNRRRKIRSEIKKLTTQYFGDAGHVTINKATM